MIHSVHIISTKSSELLFSHYCGAPFPLGNEFLLAAILEDFATLNSWDGKRPLTIINPSCQLPFVFVADSDLIYVLVGSEHENSLSLIEDAPLIINVVTATCEKRPNAALLQQLRAKVSLCLSEAFPLGERQYSSIHDIMNAAKMKSFN